MISINEATRQGIDRLRKPEWACPMDHMKIDLVGSRSGYTSGPWGHLHSPMNNAINGRDPIDFPILNGRDVEEWEQYEGPLHDSEEYKDEARRCSGAMSNVD